MNPTAAMKNSTHIDNAEISVQNGALLSRRVAMFRNAFDKGRPRSVEVGKILDAIRCGKYASQIQGLRQTLGRDRKAYDEQKPNLAAFCVSGTAASRTHLAQHSGLLKVDLDKTGERLDEMRQRLKSDKHVAFGFVSPGGEGLKLGVVIDGSRHLESFHVVEAYFLDRYNVPIDKKCKDTLRLCFVSYDPELWVNPDAEPFTIEETQAGAGRPETNGQTHAENKSEFHE